MLPELPPEEDRPGVPIAPPLLFVLPILASLALECLFRPASCMARSDGHLGWRSWSIPRGCCWPCRSVSCLSIASSSRAKNDILSASSERDIPTTNAGSGAGSSVYCVGRIRLTAIKYEERTSHMPNSSATDLLRSPTSSKTFHKQSSRQCSKCAIVSSVSSPMLERRKVLP